MTKIMYEGVILDGPLVGQRRTEFTPKFAVAQIPKTQLIAENTPDDVLDIAINYHWVPFWRDELLNLNGVWTLNPVLTQDEVIHRLLESFINTHNQKEPRYV